MLCAMVQTLYLYALIKADADLPEGARGIAGQALRKVSVGPLAAVVSPVCTPHIRPERAKLLHHQSLLAGLLRQGPLLPFAFGTIATGDQALVQLLTANLPDLEAELLRIGDHIEIGVTAEFEDSGGHGIHAKLTARDAGLQSYSRRIFGTSVPPARNAMIELGMRFEQVLERTRELLAASVLTGLAPLCDEWKQLDCHSPSQLLNLAFLIRRDHETEFSHACDAVAADLDDDLVLRVNGPWAPFSFIKLAIDFGHEPVSDR